MHGLSRRSRYVSGTASRLQRGQGRSPLDRDRVTAVQSKARAGQTRRVRYVLSVFWADSVGAEPTVQSEAEPRTSQASLALERADFEVRERGAQAPTTRLAD